MNIYRLLHCPAMWLCTLLVALSSCIAELTDPAGISSGLPTQEKVIIDLQLPQSGIPLTRAVAAGPQATTRSQEGTVNDVYVLAFGTEAEEPFLYYVKAVQQEGTQWEATLQLLEGREQSFVVIANVENQKGDLKTQLETLLDQGGSKGQLKSTLLRKLYVGDNTALVAAETAPLCGQSAPTRIYSGYGQKLDVKLHRMTASLSFYVGDKAGSGIDGFELTSINLCNVQGKGSVIPLELAAGFEGPVTKVTLPQTGTGQEEDAPLESPLAFPVTGNVVENQIYFFESEQPTSADDSQRPCIVIGGTWNKKAGFWRIDFKTDPHNKGSYVDLLRNHNYSFTLVSVRSEGADGIESALAKSENDLVVEAIVMDDYSISNVAFDGQNFLGIQHKSYTVNRYGVDATTGLKTLTQEVIAKNDLDWKAELIDADGNGGEDFNWISFAQDSDSKTAGGTGNGTSTETLNFYVDEWTDAPVGGKRTALMRFTAGNLLVEATVTQTDDYTVNLELTSAQELIINPDGTVKTPVDVKFGPAGATLEWALIKGEGIEATHGETGSASTNNPEETVQIGTGTYAITAADLNAQTDLLYADYETSLMIVARLGNAVKSLTIPVKQTKLGLELLDADGEYQPMRDYMTFNTNSNFEWTVSIVENESSAGHFVKKVDPANNTGSGEYYTSTDANFSLLTYNLSDDIDGENYGELKLRFDDNNSDFYVDKVIKFRSGLTISGEPMKIVGPYYRTPNQLKYLIGIDGVSQTDYKDNGRWIDERVAQFISTKLGNNECIMYQKPGGPEGAYIPGALYEDKDGNCDPNRRWVPYAVPRGNGGPYNNIGFHVDTYRNGQKYVDPLWTINVSTTFNSKDINFWPWDKTVATEASFSVTFPKETTIEYQNLGEQFLTFGLFIDPGAHYAVEDWFGGRGPEQIARVPGWNNNDYIAYTYIGLLLYRYEKADLPAGRGATRYIAGDWTDKGKAILDFDMHVTYNHDGTPFSAAETRYYKTFYLVPRAAGESSGVENIYK